MKQPKLHTLQLLLPLRPERAPANLPADKQRDLAQALAELFLKAAVASGNSQSERPRKNESETHA